MKVYGKESIIMILNKYNLFNVIVSYIIKHVVHPPPPKFMKPSDFSAIQFDLPKSWLNI